MLSVSACLARGQDAATDRARLASLLDFELGAQSNGAPVGWGGGPAGTVFADNTTFHGGKWSAQIERDQESPEGSSVLRKSVLIDFQGSELELKAFIRTENVNGEVRLIIRENGEVPMMVNNERREIRGTTGWTEYSVRIRHRPDTRRLEIMVVLLGTGKAWVDDFQVLLDSRPLQDAPKYERPTALELDHEFDRGSGISIGTLSPVQVVNLATLGKVWGFLKYHHPAVTSGKRHWDYDLFRILPSIMAATDWASANTVMAKWVGGLGEVPSCVNCAVLDAGTLQMRPDLDWITREAVLGKELSKTLMEVYRNRTAGKQFYVDLDETGWASFYEKAYRDLKLPDAGFQLLALYRFWNIVEYWFPYRDIIGEHWDQVLTEFVPRLAFARDAKSYQLELLALIARARDTHSAGAVNGNLKPPAGDCRLPITIRFVENQPVVVAATDEQFQVGDTLVDLDGMPVGALLSAWKPYYPASNDAALQNDIAQNMTRGTCGEAAIRIRRDNDVLRVTSKRYRPTLPPPDPHDLPGETFRLLSPEVAYLKMSSVRVGDVRRYIESAAGTRGLIIDLRNYPSVSVKNALGQLLVDQEVVTEQWTSGDLANPGAFHWAGTVSLKPQNPHYFGKFWQSRDPGGRGHP